MTILKCCGLKCKDGLVTHIDNKGFIYCKVCGENRKLNGRKCRKLKSSELKTLLEGKPIAKY